MAPELSRRRLLTGGTVAAAGLLGGATFLPSGFLPDGVAVARTWYRPIPDIEWRPPVTATHAEASRNLLRDTVTRAEHDLDAVGSVDDSATGVAPERALDEARDHLGDAAGTADWETLRDVRNGLDAAGRAIGGVRLAAGTASGEHLATQARTIQEELARASDRISYRVADPSRGLARLYWAERWLSLGLLHTYRNGTYAGQEEPTTEYDDYSLISTWGSHMQARGYALDAKHLAADYRDSVGDAADRTDHVEAVAASLQDGARTAKPGLEAQDRREETLRAIPDGTRRTFEWQQFRAKIAANVFFDRGPWAGVPLYRAVTNAEALLVCRGADAALARSDLGRGDEVTPSMLDQAKRTALRLLDERLTTPGPPRSWRSWLANPGGCCGRAIANSNRTPNGTTSERGPTGSTCGRSATCVRFPTSSPG
ncbi:hypothetical protein VB773_04380 [Haloarculaceae archaeon H-GB2-1]|nr:hypothetical protein [Haloarculaceae archaeon H-GB2-1]